MRSVMGWGEVLQRFRQFARRIESAALCFKFQVACFTFPLFVHAVKFAS